MDGYSKHEGISKGTHKTDHIAHIKIAGRDQKLYTGEPFLETSSKLEAAFKQYFDSGYKQLYLK